MNLNPAAIALFFVAFHMIGDYVTQTNWMAANKFENWGVRLLHVSAYSFPFLVLGLLSLPERQACQMFLWVLAPHFIIDCRRWASPVPWPPKPIMVDQALHSLHLAIVFAWFYGR